MKSLLKNNININLKKNKSGFLKQNNSKKNRLILKSLLKFNIIQNIKGNNVQFCLYKNNKKIKSLNDNFNK